MTQMQLKAKPATAGTNNKYDCTARISKRISGGGDSYLPEIAGVEKEKNEPEAVCGCSVSVLSQAKSFPAGHSMSTSG